MRQGGRSYGIGSVCIVECVAVVLASAYYKRIESDGRRRCYFTCYDRQPIYDRLTLAVDETGNVEFKVGNGFISSYARFVPASYFEDGFFDGQFTHDSRYFVSFIGDTCGCDRVASRFCCRCRFTGYPGCGYIVFGIFADQPIIRQCEYGIFFTVFSFLVFGSYREGGFFHDEPDCCRSLSIIDRSLLSCRDCRRTGFKQRYYSIIYAGDTAVFDRKYNGRFGVWRRYLQGKRCITVTLFSEIGESQFHRRDFYGKYTFYIDKIIIFIVASAYRDVVLPGLRYGCSFAGCCGLDGKNSFGFAVDKSFV